MVVCGHASCRYPSALLLLALLSLASAVIALSLPSPGTDEGGVIGQQLSVPVEPGSAGRCPPPGRRWRPTVVIRAGFGRPRRRRSAEMDPHDAPRPLASTLTIQLMPNLSMSQPIRPPQGCSVSGILTVPPSARR